VVTHRLEQVVPLAHHFLVMVEGRIIMEGSAAEIFSRPDVLERCGHGPAPGNPADAGVGRGGIALLYGHLFP